MAMPARAVDSFPRCRSYRKLPARAVQASASFPRRRHVAIRQPTKQATARHDVLTVCAVAVIVYALSSLLHEAVGHGGACLLVKAVPLELSSMNFECSVMDDGSIADRIVAAGGTIATLLGGGLAMWLYSRAPRNHIFRYGLWLFAAINLMQGTGYFLFSGVGNIGDWAQVIKGWEPAWAWRSGLAIGGGVLYFLVTRWVFHILDPFMGEARPRRYRHAMRLGLYAYLAGALLEIAAGAFNPGGLMLVLVSGGAASLGGTSGLVWGPQTVRGSTTPSDMLEVPVALVDRSWFTVVLAIVVAAAFIAVFGKGVTFSH